MVENFYMLSDTEIVKRISDRLKGVRLKQNISRQDLADSTGVSVSSIVRMEEGEIKSFDSFLRVLRTLGKMDILLPLVEEEELSPNEYFNAVQAAKNKIRKRASKSKGKK
ncbi:MAG: helix-turn-helix transcriptional regulator [Bacteroidales bacterium]|nr:helix-turn-helix transcriptional regulator [Candidatus Cacconaster equifaecalis]